MSSEPPGVDQVIAARMRERRTALGWSQRRLADVMFELVTDPVWNQQRVALLEGDKTTMRARELAALALALRVSPGWLCTPEGGGPVRLGSEVVPMAADESEQFAEATSRVAEIASRYARALREVTDRARRLQEAIGDLMDRPVKELPDRIRIAEREVTNLQGLRNDLEYGLSGEAFTDAVSSVVRNMKGAS